MGLKRSHLTYLSMVGILFLGGCSWIANLEWPHTSEVPSKAPIASESVNPQDAEIAPSPTTESLTVEANPTAAVDINHGERLSTLEKEGLLPPGRLPPGIVPATGDIQRLPQIEPGRRDPFASLPVRPFLVQRQPIASSSIPAIAATPTASMPLAPTPALPSPSTRQSVVPPSPQTVAPVPLAPQLPTLPQAPTVPTVPTAPTIPGETVPVSERFTPGVTDSVSVASAGSPPSFEFSGVVQVGDRVNIIVEEPSGSRYVQVGARVGNGQFVIKAVDFNQGETPAVILEKGGMESVHWVGSPIAL